MRTVASALVATGLFASVAAAQTSATIQFETFTLSNGLTFIVHEDHSTPIVAVDVWYDVGSANEVEGRSGFAHLFEHMLFGETEHLENGDFKEFIRAAGGTYNGTTNTDRTNYFETLPSNRLNLAFWLESERMARLRVTEENFKREREVVKEERRLRIDNQPYGAASIALDTLTNHWPPYKHSVIGSMDDLDAARPEDVLAFYRQYYVPNNATIVVAGDVTLADVKKLANEYFGAIPRGPERPPLPPMPPTPRTDGEKRITIEAKLANTPLMFAAFNTPPHDHADTHSLQLLSAIFSQGEASRLHQRLVKEEKAALAVGSELASRMGPAFFYFFALPNQGVTIEHIEALVAEEIEKLTSQGVTERELQKAKNQFQSGQIFGRQSVFSKAESLHHYRRYHGDLAEINTDIDKYMAVTSDDIRAVASKYLTPSNRTVIIAMPPQRAAASSDGAQE